MSLSKGRIEYEGINSDIIDDMMARRPNNCMGTLRISDVTNMNIQETEWMKRIAGRK